MIDRWIFNGLCVALAALALVTGQGALLSLVVVFAGLAFALGVLLPLLLHESVWQFFASRPTRALLVLRWHRKGKPEVWATQPKTARLARKVIEAAGFSMQPGDGAEAARLKALLDRLVRLNLNAPSALQAGLGEEALTAALKAVAPDAFAPGPKGYGAMIHDAWPDAKVAPGPVRLVMRGVALLCFGFGVRAVQAAIRSTATSIIRFLPVDDRIKGDKDYPAYVLAAMAGVMLRGAGLPVNHSHLCDLPLTRQRQLVAAQRMLMGAPAAVRLARLLNPSSRAFLDQVAAERQAHVAAMAEADQRQKAAAENRATREEVRAATLTAEERAAILDRIALPGIHLRRVWPLRHAAAHRGHSWLGGRPCLPAHIDWPRGPKTGLPLHFLAQIDCAELPRPSALPPDGRLMFFADIDEEMLLDDNQGFAVIHVPAAEATDTERAPPPDLPEIDHDSTGRSARSEPFRREYPRWPVLAAPVTDYAIGQDPWSSRPDIEAAAHDLLLAQVVDLLPPDRRPKPRYRPFVKMVPRREPDGTQSPPAYELDTALLGEGYLRSWAIVGELIRALRDDARERVTRAEVELRYAKDEDRRQSLQARLAKSQAFAAEVAEFAGLDDGQDPAARPPAAITDAIDEWLQAAAPAFHNLGQPLTYAFAATARRAATDASLRGALTPRIWRLTAPALKPRLDGSHHMMLGAAQRVTNSTESTGVRLLCLDSDRGLDFNFCDAGVIEFWIDAEDLAARRFDRVRAETAGG